MKRLDIMRRAGKNLRQAKLRTVFTSMAIAVGAFTIMMALAAGEGTRGYTSSLIESNANPQALFIVKDPSLFESGPGASTGLTEYEEGSTGTAESSAGAEIEPLTQEDVDAIAARDDIESALPIYTLQTQSLLFDVKDDTRYAASEVSTYDPDVLGEAAAGELPAQGSDIGDDEIVIPESFATELGVSADELAGSTVTVTIAKPAPEFSEERLFELLQSGASQQEISAELGGEEREIALTIRAVTKQSSMSFSSPTSALVSAKTAKEIYTFTTEGTDSYGEFFGMTAEVKEGVEPQTVKDELANEGYGVQTVEDLQALIFTVVNVIQWIVAGFGILALIASVFGIVNTMYISVLERTSQIGLMRALGMRKQGVARLFRYEAAWIGLFGGLIGIGLALLAVTLLNPFITESLDLGEGNTLLAFSWWQAGVLLIGLVVIAVSAGWFPARKAAKLDPIEALRTE